MNKYIKSQAGDWSQWTEAQKQALTELRGGTQVGDRMVFANDTFRVWSIHLPAGQSMPFHKHAKPYFWTAVAGGKARSYYGDGSIVENEYLPGDTKYFANLSEDNYFIHNLENIGEKTLVFTTVEFVG